MLGFSMVQLVWKNSQKFDKKLREEIIHLYRPFRYVPCFLHRTLENLTKRIKRFPVIIEFDQEKAFHTSMKNTRKCIKQSKIRHEVPSISCCSAILTASDIENLIQQHPNIKKIHYDREVEAMLDVASPSIHTPQLNQRGLTGHNINIAIIDTGIYPHQDLTKPTNRMVAFKDFVKDKQDPYDDNGHGTHCAGDAVGNGFASDGKYRGPAPEAGVIGVKVLNKMGKGLLSKILLGVQWCMDHQLEYNISIISLSLGSSADQSSCDDPMVQIVEKAWDKGFIVCAAAGNAGPDNQKIGSPGNSSKIITVGAIDDKNTPDRSDDEIASFSSRGIACGQESKPDLLTPGVGIISLRSPHSFLDKTLKSARIGQNYMTLSGTSMATPICAGASALVLQAYPNHTPDDVKQHLLEGSEDRGLPSYVQGSGYLDTEKAVDQGDNAREGKPW